MYGWFAMNKGHYGEPIISFYNKGREIPVFFMFGMGGLGKKGYR